MSKKPAAKKGASNDDKTFGMKNKKGKSAQKMQNSYQNAGKSKQDLQKEQEKRAAKEKKKLEEKEKAERDMLFRQMPVNKIQQKAPPGVDPMSVLCLNFKAGKCIYGDKCKFSHDLAVERKSEKRDIYSDSREGVEGEGDMSTWDDKTLAEVVAKKAIGKPHNPAAGICKHFLQAVEGRKYGWFWECPNGDKCMYRHALPPGFVLKRDQKKEEKTVEPNMDDVVEEERAALKDGGTPMTEDNFKKWKERRVANREKEKKKQKADHEKQMAGRKTGRQVFEESKAKLDDEDDAEDGGDADIFKLLKEKKEEEERMDKENAELVEIMQKEMAELDKEGEKRVEEEIAQIQKQKKQQAEDGVTEDTTTTTTTTTTETTDSTEPESTEPSTLEGVDTALFEEDEELPEFDEQ